MEQFDIVGNGRKVAAIDHRPLISFSLGVDSIAMWLRIKEIADDTGLDISKSNLFYMYFVKGLPFVEDYIDYFERHEGVKIAQVPHNVYLEALASWHWQPPLRSHAVSRMQGTNQSYVPLSKEQIEGYIKQVYRYPKGAYTCVGVKCGDSAMRRMAMRKTGGLNTNKLKYYPIADFENRDVVDIIKRHGIKVPVDYRLFGISYENIQYRFLKIISEQCPISYQMILDEFPLAKISLARYDRYHPEWTGDGMIKGRKRRQFEDMIIEPRVAL